MLCVLVAHKREARELIRQLSLNAISPRHFQAEGIQVYITGQGMENAITAVETLLPQLPADTIWLNYGIAGDANRQVGELVCISQIQLNTAEIVNLKNPLLQKCINLPKVGIRSVATVQNYIEDWVQDMELAGLAQAFNVHAKLGSLLAIKVISDNETQPHSELNKNTIERLLQQALPQLLSIIKCLRKQDFLLQSNKL